MLRYNNKRDSDIVIWVMSKGWDLTVCWQCWDSLVSLHNHVCACSAIGLGFVCSLQFITTPFCLKLARVNWVAGGTKGDCWSLSSKSCWTCHLPSLLWWSSSKSLVAWASKHPVQLGKHGAHVWGVMEIRQLAQIKQEVLTGSFSLVLFCQLWVGGVNPTWSDGCWVAEGDFRVGRQDSC